MGFFKKKKHVKSSLNDSQAYDLMVRAVKSLMGSYLNQYIIKTLNLNAKVGIGDYDEDKDRYEKYIKGISFNPYDAAYNYNQTLSDKEKIPLRDLTNEYTIKIENLIKEANSITNKKYVFIEIYDDADWDDPLKIYAKTEGYIKEDSIDSYLSVIDSINE